MWTRLREEVKKVVEVENVEEIMLEEVCKVKIQEKVARLKRKRSMTRRRYE